MSRANGQGKIFETEVDRQYFVRTQAEACAKIGFEIHACGLRAHQFPEATLAELLCDFGRIPSVAPISSEQRWAG
jgi:hypothetical protein